MYSSAADKIEFATGGGERVQISSNGTKLTTLNALSSAASVFLTSDSGIVKTRTAAQVRSDIGAGTGSGDITAVVAGAGLTGGATSGSATLNLDIDGTNNYIEMNNDITPASGDFIPFSDIGDNVVRKTTFSDIPLSILNNDSSFGTMSNWFITADSGSASQVDQGETVDIQGTAPISTSVSSNTVTLTHDNSGVTAGSYTNASITVNATGHITAASNGSSGVTGSGTTNFISVINSYWC